MAELDTSSKGGGKHKGKGKKSKKMSTRVDLTPMVDLGFLLVTFFMLTTTFSKPQTMEVKWPSKNDKTDKPKDAPAVKQSASFNVILGPNSKIYYYSGMFSKTEKPELKVTDYSSEGIRRLLLAEKKQRGDELFVFIKALDDANYKNIVDLLDEINITSIKTSSVFLVDVTEDEKQFIKDSNL